jgi:flagellar motor component MotA
MRGSRVTVALSPAAERCNRAKRRHKIQLPRKEDFLDLLKCLFQIFQAMRREGVVALEAHVQDPHKSTIFKLRRAR